VDAAASARMESQGEFLVSDFRRAGRTAPGPVEPFGEDGWLRTAKACGPDASTPASSSREAGFSGVTVTKKSDRRGATVF